MFKNNWIKVLGIFVLFVFVALGTIGGCHDNNGGGDGDLDGEPPLNGQSHTINVINSCSQTIWVGIFANAGEVESITIGDQNITTLGGFELDSGQTALVNAPLNWTSARIWARTGCTFDSSGVCPTPTTNCCDTGGCTDDSSEFVLNCFNPGVNPATLAEFTFADGIQDSYDVSLVDGGNVSVEIVPNSDTYDCQSDLSCIWPNNLPGTNSPNCLQDSDCQSIFGTNSSAAWKCDTSLDGGLGLCVNPFRCGSPGCTDSGGCAALGIEQTLLPSCQWVSGSDLAISEESCPTPLQIINNQSQYVGCIGPQDACALGFSGIDCGPNHVALYECTGSNSGSCFSSGADSSCCGCPTWAPQAACVSDNPTWHTDVEIPYVQFFNAACGTAYSFPYDDQIKAFTCIAESGSTTEYTVTFCPPVSPIPTPTPTPAPVPTCPPGTCSGCSSMNPFCCPATGGCASSVGGLSGCSDTICTIE